MDLKAAVTGSDRKAILESCEYGEKVAIDAYQNVLEEDMEEVTYEQRAMLNSHLSLLKADYEKVMSMQELAQRNS